MSRFFRGGGSSSDSSSESGGSSDEEELYGRGQESDEEDREEEDGEEEEDEDDGFGSEGSESSEDSDAFDAARKKHGAAAFLKGADLMSDDSDDEGKRIVKSARDKRIEEVEQIVKAIENAEKINDWGAISSEFDRLGRAMAKLPQMGPAYKIFLKISIQLEEYAGETASGREKEKAKKKMNATNLRAFNSFTQKIKRNNRTLADDIEKYKVDPTQFDGEQPKKQRKRREEEEDEDEDEDEVAEDLDDNEGFVTVGKGGKLLTYTPETIVKHLRSIYEARGKKGTDQMEQTKMLEQLKGVAVTPYQRIRVFLALLASRFDYNTVTDFYMPIDEWTKALEEVNELLEIVKEHQNYLILEDVEDLDDDFVPNPQTKDTVKVRGSLVAVVDRLDDEFTRSLQNVDPHTPEYIERLKDETKFYRLLVASQAYFETMDMQESVNRVIMRRVEHLYYKSRSLIATLESTIQNQPVTEQDAAALIERLCITLYSHGQPILKTRAMLCHIYSCALHNEYYRARDMLLMSHIQESIHNADVSTQILFNRAMMQLGMCSFKLGMIAEALASLQEMHSTSRVKELLAQGITNRYGQLTTEQEQAERQRQLPFHMYINLELLEAAFLTCSMLMEVPAMAAAGSSPEAKRRVISKSFRRHLEYADRQLFVGPPENTRDFVIHASKYLMAGDWAKCRDLIHSIAIWDLLPDTEGTKMMLAAKIQEEGLRTYLLTYSGFYDTIAIRRLAQMFSLPEARVTGIVSNMIAQDEIHAALDRVDSAIVMQKVNHSKLQTFALALADKANYFQEQNERAVDQRQQQQSQQNASVVNSSSNIATAGARAKDSHQHHPQLQQQNHIPNGVNGTTARTNDNNAEGKWQTRQPVVNGTFQTSGVEVAP